MIAFAREIGAMRNGKPDWYAVAEHLAEKAQPDLLDGVPANRPPGRPGKDWFFLFTDVDMVRRQTGCSVPQACQRLTKGYLPHHALATLTDGTKIKVRLASENWKGQNAERLRQRYYDCLETYRKKYG